MIFGAYDLSHHPHRQTLGQLWITVTFWPRIVSVVILVR